MKVCFVYRRYENLGVEYLSAVLKQGGHEVDLIYEPALFSGMFTENTFLSKLLNDSSKTAEAALQSQPRLVCFSLVANDYQWACNIASLIKSQSNATPIIFGGIYPTSVPDKILEHDFVDYVCVGEGEEALLELCNALNNGGKTDIIENIWVKRNGRIIKNPLRQLTTSLDAFPYPDKELFHETYKGFSVDFYNVIASRGCVYSCSYCYNSYINILYSGGNGFYRRRSVGNVINELALAKKKYNPRIVAFYDDCFIADKLWLKELAQEYKAKIALPSFCFIHPSVIDDEVLGYLSDINCHAVNMGFQTFNEDLRRKYLQRNESNERTAFAVRRLKEKKIFLYFDIILGLPYQDEKELVLMAEFINKIKPDSVFISWLTCFPKTSICDLISREKPYNKEEIHLGSSGTYYIYTKGLARLGRLIMISNILPCAVFRAIVRMRLYRIFPPLKYSFSPANAFLLFITAVFGKIFYRKNSTVISSLRGVLKYYLFFLRKILLKRYVRTVTVKDLPYG